MFSLKVKTHFDAAHYLKGYDGNCSRVHGHRWEVEVVIADHVLPETGMLIDFKVIKDIIKYEVLDYLDHYLLNNVEGFQDKNPTAENISKWIYDKLNHINGSSYLVEVTVWESPDCACTYSGLY